MEESRLALAPLVDELVAESGAEASLTAAEAGRPSAPRREFPSREALDELLELLKAILFPGYFGRSELTAASLRFHVGADLARALSLLGELLLRALCAADPRHAPNRSTQNAGSTGSAGSLACADCAECAARARGAVEAFAMRLPAVRRMLGSDVEAAFEGDPAATSRDEVIFCYPGLLAVLHQRLAHELHAQKMPLIPRMITERAHALTGIDIHPGAQIGERFFIDHGTGVVIGETAIIGRRVRLYQGVTLGAKRFPLDNTGNLAKGFPRHPIVEDDVTIYANATLLGRITVGRGSSIGGNVWLTRSVPAGTILAQQAPRPERFEGGAGI